MSGRGFSRRPSIGDYLLALRILWWQTTFGLLKHFAPLETLVRFAKLRPAGSRELSRERRIAQLVERVGELWRFGGTPACLERSLVLYRLLSEANASPRLMIGVSRREHAIEGHAWVLVDGRPLGDTAAVVERFMVVTSFDASGAVTPPTA